MAPRLLKHRVPLSKEILCKSCRKLGPRSATPRKCYIVRRTRLALARGSSPLSAQESVFNTPYRAFLFDMDGTVLNSIAAAERIWAAWALRHGVDVESFLPTIHGVRAIDTCLLYTSPSPRD